MHALLSAVGAILIAASFNSSVRGLKATLLLELGDNNTYELNPDALQEISKLEGPIKVISAVGKARVGKSTMLNLISHIWDEKNAQRDWVEEIFETGKSVTAVTRNVWTHIIPLPKGEKGSIFFIDVEGVDLGDDRVTEDLSMFTAMMSSSLNLFANRIVGNSDMEFLYHMSRKSDLVFQNKSDLQNFPNLHIVVRTDLEFPDDDGEYIRKGIFESSKESTKRRGKIIQKYFPRRSIEVSHIPTVHDAKILEDVGMLRNSSDWGAFENVFTKLRNSPTKKTMQGNLVDGEALKDLAENVVKAINGNEWKDFGDAYSSLEREICGRSYEKHVKPLLKRSSTKIRELMMDIIDKFREECILKSEISNAQKELRKALKDAEREENEKLRREQEDRRKQDESNSWFTYQNAKNAGYLLVSHILGYYFWSDEQLKTNVMTIPYSHYNDIGLTGVCWTWNEVAGKKFGLTGEGCGVIAQEVQALYAWAVVEGKDGGYLQVGYHILDQMINDTLTKRMFKPGDKV